MSVCLAQFRGGHMKFLLLIIYDALLYCSVLLSRTFVRLQYSIHRSENGTIVLTAIFIFYLKGLSKMRVPAEFKHISKRRK